MSDYDNMEATEVAWEQLADDQPALGDLEEREVIKEAGVKRIKEDTTSDEARTRVAKAKKLRTSKILTKTDRMTKSMGEIKE